MQACIRSRNPNGPEDLFAIAVDDAVGKRNANRYFAANPPTAIQKRMILLGNAGGTTAERMPSNALVFDSKGRRIGTIADLQQSRKHFADKVLIFKYR
jgi:hypothetical protein